MWWLWCNVYMSSFGVSCNGTRLCLAHLPLTLTKHTAWWQLAIWTVTRKPYRVGKDLPCYEPKRWTYFLGYGLLAVSAGRGYVRMRHDDSRQTEGGRGEKGGHGLRNCRDQGVFRMYATAYKRRVVMHWRALYRRIFVCQASSTRSIGWEII